MVKVLIFMSPTTHSRQSRDSAICQGRSVCLAGLLSLLVLGAGVSAGNVESGRQVVPESQRRTQLWRQVPGLRLQSQGSSHQGFIVLSKVKGHTYPGDLGRVRQSFVWLFYFFLMEGPPGSQISTGNYKSLGLKHVMCNSLLASILYLLLFCLFLFAYLL